MPRLRCANTLSFNLRGQFPTTSTLRTSSQNASDCLSESQRPPRQSEARRLPSIPSSTLSITLAKSLAMSGIGLTFWNTPVRYLRWASHEKPAIFYSIILGSLGPVAMVTIPPIRSYFGDSDPPPIPLTYPSKSDVIVPRESYGC